MDQPIGLFDSGLGGLTVLRELQRTLPRERFLYLGDTARMPYGSKGDETIVRYSRECAGFLLQHRVKLLVVACNTASALALDQLSSELRCPLIGTIEPAVQDALAAAHGGAIGVIGTEATIASGAYQRRLLQLAPQRRVIAQACPLFVPLVEQGMTSGEIVDKIVELYLEPVRQAGVAVLILGCTHYPLLKESIQSFLGPQVAIVECSKSIAQHVAKLLSTLGIGSINGHPLHLSPGHREEITRYFVTDQVPKFNHLARLFLADTDIQALKVEHLCPAPDSHNGE